jgi:hypothetical protein
MVVFKFSALDPLHSRVFLRPSDSSSLPPLGFRIHAVAPALNFFRSLQMIIIGMPLDFAIIPFDRVKGCFTLRIFLPLVSFVLLTVPFFHLSIFQPFKSGF